jgi:cyclin B
MGNQPAITYKMRAMLTEWLIESHQRFHLMPETLYLTIYIVDRYLSLQPVPRAELQLVGMAAMLIACKYEEIWAPQVRPKLHSYLAICYGSGCSKPEFLFCCR